MPRSQPPGGSRHRASARDSFRALLCAVFAFCSIHAAAAAANPRIGFLSPSTPDGSAFILANLRQGLRDHGLVDGSGVTIEARFADDQFDRLPALARELVELPVDVLVTYVTQASIAAKQATERIPIVMIGVSDPLASGLVASLSRPGGNVTGTSGAFTGMTGKGIQLLQEAVPDLRRAAVLWNPGNRVFQAQMLEEAKVSARRLDIALQLFEATRPESIETAFAAISTQRLPVIVLPDPVFARNWERIAALAAQSRLPSVSVNARYAEAGGLMTYGPSLAERARSSAGYVAKILKGAKPGELPIERPTKFELVINLKTAKQIGMTVPQSLRLRADRLLE
jgi:putative ABC transport system substrate-binding protein